MHKQRSEHSETQVRHMRPVRLKMEAVLWKQYSKGHVATWKLGKKRHQFARS